MSAPPSVTEAYARHVGISQRSMPSAPPSWVRGLIPDTVDRVRESLASRELNGLRSRD